MHDKAKCAKCKYHGSFGYGRSGSDSSKLSHIMCDYAKYEKRTCLRKSGIKIYDIRGNDFHNCKLFVRGNNPT